MAATYSHAELTAYPSLRFDSEPMSLFLSDCTVCRLDDNYIVRNNFRNNLYHNANMSCQKYLNRHNNLWGIVLVRILEKNIFSSFLVRKKRKYLFSEAPFLNLSLMCFLF